MLLIAYGRALTQRFTLVALWRRTAPKAAASVSYLSAFAAAITKTVTKERPEQNRTTSMASFVIARPQVLYCPYANWGKRGKPLYPHEDTVAMGQ